VIVIKYFYNIEEKFENEDGTYLKIKVNEIIVKLILFEIKDNYLDE